MPSTKTRTGFGGFSVSLFPLLGQPFLVGFVFAGAKADARKVPPLPSTSPPPAKTGKGKGTGQSVFPLVIPFPLIIQFWLLVAGANKGQPPPLPFPENGTTFVLQSITCVLVHHLCSVQALQ